MTCSNRFINKIVAAANVYQVTKDGITSDLVLVDNGHMCRNMQKTVKFLREIGCEVKPRNDLEDRGQGFIDESGNYHNRSEAYVIAKASGQPFNDGYTLPDQKLDSSCIRHFPGDTKLADFMSDIKPSVVQNWVKIISDDVPYYIDRNVVQSVGDIRKYEHSPGWFSRTFFDNKYELYYFFKFKISGVSETVICSTFDEAVKTRELLLGTPLS